MTAPPDKSLATRLSEAVKGLYTIEGEIGRGGMGVVYRARDERLQRRVAIKVLPPELAFQQEIRERFSREAQTAARLSHPHVVPIYDVGDKDGLVYFVMMYIDGESVGARLKRRGQLPPDEARRIMKETADALSAAHAVSIIHRDIKPDNILLEGTRSRVMVTDFGIAKALSQTSGATLTGVGIAIGTPQFMSPEQAAGEKEIDGRSDLYSLGIVSYQMLTGELPFNAPTVAGILMKQITEPPPDVARKRPDCPDDLTEAVMRCLEKDPENRWPTADALRRALESRAVSGYRPTGTSYRAAERAAMTQRPTSPRPRTGATSPRPTEPRRLTNRDRALDRSEQRGLARPSRPPMPAGGRRYERDEDQKALVRDTGEPKIIQQVRNQFATWAAVNVGLFFINVATTGLNPPWFLFPAAGMGIGLLRNYAKLWQAGYSWRDVLRRPAAADSVERTLTGMKGQNPLALPKPDELGTHYSEVQQVWSDRQAIMRIVDRLPPDEKKMLPEVQETVDGLYRRALDLGRTLHLLSADIEEGGIARIDTRLALLGDAETEEKLRQKNLLERQRKSLTDLLERRAQVQEHMESCVLAMQNMRLDLLKLKSANLSEVMGDITHATQQAKAISRNVDNAIAAAGEIREAMGR